MSEVALAMVVAWWVAVWHMLVGGYLVFFAESRTPFLTIVGVIKGMLGAAIYLTVREPLWVDTHAPSAPEIILSVTLILLLVFSGLVTGLIWQAFDLDPPQQRARELFRCGKKWWDRQRRRFGR